MNIFPPALFADADSTGEDPETVIFGVPFDGTTTFRPGSRSGPGAIRAISYNFESYIPEFDLDLAEIPFSDEGDIEPPAVPELVIAEVRGRARDIINRGAVPLMLGGEHSITTGAVEACRPDCVVICDAHLDLRDEMGGTPWSHACTTRRIIDLGVETIIHIGARSGTREQYRVADEDLIRYPSERVQEIGIRRVLDEITPLIRDRRVYLSIDADVIDCCLTPGVGNPEPFGLKPPDVREVCRTCAPFAAGMDYVEVCPIDSGQTAAVAAAVIRDFLAARHENLTHRPAHLPGF
ncbi:MAG: agmatinase [Methanoculleaceae archaeon]